MSRAIPRTRTGRAASPRSRVSPSGAPLFFIGHSAGGPQAKSLAIEMRDRCFGLVQYRGGTPEGAEKVPPGIPVLMMLGQFEYYVAYGPAEVNDGELDIAELPARARYPLEVRVVAWQFGRGVPPLVRTATPVERTVLIRKAP